MYSCYPLLRKDVVNKKGESPIYIRIVANRQSCFIPTGIKINQKDWSKAKKLPKSSFTNAVAAKHLIESYLTKIKGISYEAERTNRRLTAKQIKEAVTNENRDSLVEYIRVWIGNRKKRNEITHSTFLKYAGVADKLENVFGVKFKISDFDIEMLKQYDKALREVYGNSGNTIASNFSFLRAVANALIRDDKMELNNYPFRKWKLKFTEVQRKYITPNQIKKIENIILPPNSKLLLSKNIFLFCNQEGFRIGDALCLKVKNYTGTHFVFKSQKTKTYITLLATEKAREIIEPMLADKEPTEYIFDFLTKKRQADEVEALREQKIVTALINKNLGIISKRLELGIKISTHYARHSMATNALAAGLSLEEIKAILHHQDIKTTQIYAKAVDKMKDDSMRKIG